MRPAVAALGAGRMGRGIAQLFAYAGHEVRLLDAKPRDAAAYEALRGAALGEIGETLGTLAGLGLFGAGAVPEILSRIAVYPREEAAEALGGAAFVFEGVPEVEEAKRDALALADAHAETGAVVASTTSTFLSTRLAAMTARPGRFLNAHFLNPAPLVPLVEVSPAPSTEPDAVAALVSLLESVGKAPVLCKPSPGYIVPRIQALAMNEAARLVEEGVASAEEVDRAVLLGFGLRFSVLGLLEFVDWGGGDILHHASRSLVEATGEQRFAAPAIVSRNMAEGRIGMRTGRGFLDWEAMDVAAHRRARLGAFVEALRRAGLARPPVLSESGRDEAEGDGR